LYKELLKRLPETPGILGRAKYFNSVVFVPFLDIAGECHILFEKRALDIRQGGEISFPGGRPDNHYDGTIQDTALRETMEELGLARDKIIIDGQLDTLVAPMGAIVDVFIGRITDAAYANYPVNSAEVEYVFALPFRFFLENEPEIYHVRLEIQSHITRDDGSKEILLPTRELGLPGRYHDSWGGKRHEVYVYRTDEGVLWGLTAEIVRDLVGRMQ